MQRMAKRKRFRTWRVVLLVLVLGLLVWGFSAWMNSGIVVSPETTFITGPLRADGTVDYLAALNNLSSKGVTPENNAAVLLLKAVGPREISEDVRERFFQMLGVEPPSQEGSYFESFERYRDARVCRLRRQRVAACDGML